MGTLRLGVNIDHIATLRQARYATMPESKNAEPDPIAAASICERAGAHGITAHLRADRRHIQDRDMERLRANIMTKLNFEMGNTPEILDFAIRIRPDEVCLVPEKRGEVTTEGGLDHRQSRDLLKTIQRLHANGIRVSLFIDPDENRSMRNRTRGGNGRIAHRQTGERVHRESRGAGAGSPVSTRGMRTIQNFR